MKRNKRTTYQNLSTVIQQLRLLNKILYPIQKKTILSKQTPIDPVLKLSIIARDLESLRNQVINYRKKETQHLVATNKYLLRLSTFELMEHNFRENTHSNVLAYLFDSTNYYGSKLLCRFVESIDSESGRDISRLVRKNSYTIEREMFVGNGRMDLFISDSTHKYVIIIENKIYANVGERNDVNEKEEPITQLSIYRNYVERNYKTYKKLYILLSHSPLDKEHPPFIFTDYKNMYNILNSIETNDPIVEQYKLLLHSLVHKLVDKRKLIKLISSIDTDNNIDLNTLELINGVLYERN